MLTPLYQLIDERIGIFKPLLKLVHAPLSAASSLPLGCTTM